MISLAAKRMVARLTGPAQRINSSTSGGISQVDGAAVPRGATHQQVVDGIPDQMYGSFMTDDDDQQHHAIEFFLSETVAGFFGRPGRRVRSGRGAAPLCTDMLCK